MPEGTHTDRTVIELAGRMDASLSGAGRAAETVLGRIQAASTRATMSMTTGFAKAERSMTAGLGGMSKSMIGWGIGVATAAAGFATLKGFIDEAMAAFSEEKVGATTRKMMVALANNKSVAAGGTKAIQEQAEAITKTSERMEKFSSINEAIYRSAFATMTTYGFNAKQIAKLSTGMADYAAETTGAKTTMEDMNALAERIAKAVASHKIGLLGKELGITAAEWKKIHSSAQALDLIEAKMEIRARGQASALAKSPVGIAIEAENEKNRAMAAYGELFKGIQRDWTTTVDRMMAKALPWALPAVRQADSAIRKMFDTLSSPAMAGFWTAWTADVNKFQTTLAPLGEALAKAFTSEAMTKDWQEFFANLQQDMRTIETLTGWFGKLTKAVDDSLDATERFGRQLRAAIGAPPPPELQHGRDPATSVEGGAARGDQNPLFKTSRQVAEEQQRLAGVTREQRYAADAGRKADDALSASTAAATSMLSAFTNALQFLTSKMGNFPITGFGGSNQPLTEYGPGVDWPGHGTPDADSARSIGHIGGVPYHLEEGDAAMKADYARKHYHIKPGESYLSDKDKKRHRWRDTTGARNPENEDIFREKKPVPYAPGTSNGATIQYNPTIHLNGPADKSALSSLDGILKDHSRHLLELLDKAHSEDFRTSFA